jgi:Protein of unknown function (DUF3141)
VLRAQKIRIEPQFGNLVTPHGSDEGELSEGVMNMQPTATSLSQTNSKTAGQTDPFRAALPQMGAPVVTDYLTDAFQRTVLYLDLLRRRGNEQEEMTSRPLATVLRFDHEILISGRSLQKPINFSLSRIAPPEGTVTDPRK